MRLRRWPVNTNNGCPAETVAFEGTEAEVVLYDAGGWYRLMPKAVIANALEQMLQIKKAEGTKSLMPPVLLRFDQSVPIDFEVAKVLLEELDHELPDDRS